MQKYLLAALCVASFAYAGHFEKVKKAVIDSDLGSARILIGSPLSQDECEKLIMLADLIIEKRQINYDNNHCRHLLSSETLAWLCGIYACKRIMDMACTAPFTLTLSILRRNSSQLRVGIADLGLGIIAAGIATCGIRSLCKSFTAQATELEQLYSNALMIKYELETKLKDLLAQP